MHDRRIAVAAAGSVRGGSTVPSRSTRPPSTIPAVVAAGYGLALSLVGGVLIGYSDGVAAWSGLGAALVATGVVLAVAGVLLGQRRAPKPQRLDAVGAADVVAERLPAELVLPPMPAAGVDILAAGITADLGELLRRGPATSDAAAADVAADLGELLRRVALIARQCPPSELRPEVEVTVRLPALQSRDTARAFVLALCSIVFFLVALLSSSRGRGRRG
ncbi:MAG: hypothetical protein ACT4QF_04200 [Sporichthyaceae bacterium]